MNEKTLWTVGIIGVIGFLLYTWSKRLTPSTLSASQAGGVIRTSAAYGTANVVDSFLTGLSNGVTGWFAPRAATPGATITAASSNAGNASQGGSIIASDPTSYDFGNEASMTDTVDDNSYDPSYSLETVDA